MEIKHVPGYSPARNFMTRGSQGFVGQSSPNVAHVKVKVGLKERIVLREIHLRTTGRHLSMGSHSVICHPTELTASPTRAEQPSVLDKFFSELQYSAAFWRESKQFAGGV